MVDFSLIRLNHVCSPQSLIAILDSKEFKVSHDTIHGGIGINGYIDGYPVCANQKIAGRGAELIIECQGELIELGSQGLPTDLIPNSIYRQGASRSIIPANSSFKSVKVIGFTIHDFALKKIGLRDRIRLYRLSSKVSKKPIIVSIASYKSLALT